MADASWIEIYSSYTGEELAAEIVQLKGELTIYRTQSVGSKSFERDLESLKNRLHAAVRARNEKNNAGKSNSVKTAPTVMQIIPVTAPR